MPGHPTGTESLLLLAVLVEFVVEVFFIDLDFAAIDRLWLQIDPRAPIMTVVSELIFHSPLGCLVTALQKSFVPCAMAGVAMAIAARAARSEADLRIVAFLFLFPAVHAGGKVWLPEYGDRLAT
ncbi:hypothetical protein [Komagataeibacter oboediens]|uniref:hypothetical protein n=1 Tax=Komagataeibacter oboediens TaxID=65958 RepID=UPI001C2D35B1|nr:hypothetical protein [Komagataeibacter oboediens]MBV1825335.1 hypothetical protein [Komagataeibacter oboediens]